MSKLGPCAWCDSPDHHHSNCPKLVEHNVTISGTPTGDGDTRLWRAYCSCGWNGPDRYQAFGADDDKAAHLAVCKLQNDEGDNAASG